MKILGSGGTATATNNKGYFLTSAALISAYPVGQNGWFAIVGATDTAWVWDGDTAAWKDSGQSTPGDVTGPAGATGDNIAVYNGASGKIIKDGGSAISALAGTNDARITSYGIPLGIDGGRFAIKAGTGATKTFSGTGTVNIASVAHGVQTGDNVLFTVSTIPAELPIGVLYRATRVDADNFTVPATGGATGGTCTWILCSGSELMIRTKFTTSAWEFDQNIAGNMTLWIFYKASQSGTYADITGGGLALTALQNTAALVTTLAQYGYLQLAISSNAGAVELVSGGFKGTKVV